VAVLLSVKLAEPEILLLQHQAKEVMVAPVLDRNLIEFLEAVVGLLRLEITPEQAKAATVQLLQFLACLQHMQAVAVVVMILSLHMVLE
jgi:hypothetical protein